MRVAQVCPRYYPHAGGVETVVKETSERLVKKGFKVKVLTTDPSGELLREENVNGVWVKRFKVWAPNESYYLPYPDMLSGLLEEQADIIHAHSIHALTTYMMYIVHKLHAKPKFVVSPYYHGKGHTKLAQMLWLPYRPLAKRILKNSDGIVVNSRSQRTLIERTFAPSSKIFMVYDGVNLDKIRNAEPFALDDNCRILLYIGRLEKYKNVHITIESMKYLPENYYFYVIGRGPFQSCLENLVKSLGLESRVHFLGFQPDNIVFRWRKTAHVFVHLSAVESFGMTCIESLAAGTPVIANDDGLGLSETIALFPDLIRMHKVGKDSFSKLARLIMDVAELKPIAADVLQFSWDFVTKSVSEAYKEMLMEQ